MKMKSLVRASFASLFVLTSASAVTVSSTTITNAQHYGRRGNANNTVSLYTPGAGTVRTIYVNGTLTSTNTETWGKFLRVQPTGAGLASGQTYFQFSEELNFSAPIPAAATIVVPGGMSAAAQLRLEAYSPDSESSVPGLDGRSTLTYTFDDAYPAGAAEFSGALTTTDPKYNRLVRFFDLELSATGTAVYYDVHPFSVAADGRYTISLAAGYDSFVSLYGGSFDPSQPLINGIEVNDEGINVLRRAGFAAVNSDTDTNGTSLLTADLIAGVQYYSVISSYSNGLTGSYSGVVHGAGAVSLGAIPEPALGAAFLAFSAVFCRKRR
jgi:hypothetical protein